MENYNVNREEYGEETAKRFIGENIGTFVEQININNDKFSGQDHSSEVSAFAKRVNYMVTSHMYTFGEFGVSQNEGRLQFNREDFDKLTPSDMNRQIGENLRLLRDIENVSQKMMSAPLADYMNFKGFDFYYNYSYGTNSDTFRIIEAGMLVDVLV
jgi:hypothetical protein